MNEETPEIIEVEAVDATPDNGAKKVRPQEQAAPKKSKYDHQKGIDRLSKAILIFSRLFLPCLILGTAIGLSSAILFGQEGGWFFFALMILGFVVLFAGVLVFLLSFPFRALLRRYMKEDPNYSSEE